ncbi:uncharacterized protein LOC124950085 isoform X2 [Vespa velutina]|uniref:uncharacterized protein LOC124950085 isoform X2 n=1 Tax=Vespa velutina TaxID=202808 RepID=UPI001FB29EA6|nr:uncharacterized protein LOC124950085 isoform X2 [Vespa velutina]
MLHCFKKGNSVKDTADEICTVYGNDTMTIRIVCNYFKKFRAGNFDLKKMKTAAAAQERRIRTSSRICSLKIREIVDATNIPKTTMLVTGDEIWILYQNVH